MHRALMLLAVPPIRLPHEFHHHVSIFVLDIDNWQSTSIWLQTFQALAEQRQATSSHCQLTDSKQPIANSNQPTPMTYPFSDLNLSRRLERAEGRANAALVESRARFDPSSGAEWFELAGAYAMFDGVGSNLTQTFGLGLFDPIGDVEMEALESFFEERGARVFHEVSPMAPAELLILFAERGYHPVEQTSILYQPIATTIPATTGEIHVRRAGDDDIDMWCEVSARGWEESEEIAEFIRSFGRISAASDGAALFIAELEGHPIATGTIHAHDNVALLAGASTVPEGRNKGAQLALLATRLNHAIDCGCDLAMMGAAPGSASQRNAERQGFRIAYTRTKWGR